MGDVGSGNFMTLVKAYTIVCETEGVKISYDSILLGRDV